MPLHLGLQQPLPRLLATLALLVAPTQVWSLGNSEGSWRLLPNKEPSDEEATVETAVTAPVGGSWSLQGATVDTESSTFGAVSDTAAKGATLGSAIGHSATDLGSSAAPQDDEQRLQLQRLLEQISQYKGYDPATAENNLNMRWVDYAAREDEFIAGIRVQIRGTKIYYRPAPASLLDSKRPEHKDMFSWWQQTSAHLLVFLRRTLKMHGSLPFVDATYALSDLCRDNDGNGRAQKMFYSQSIDHRDFFHKSTADLAGVGEDIAPIFTWNARKECRAIVVPNYDWLHYSENFTDGSTYKLNSGDAPMPWGPRQPKMVWRGEALSWDGSRARALRLGLLYPELMDIKTTSPMNSGECFYYQTTINEVGLKPVNGPTPNDLVKDCQMIWGGPSGFMPLRAQESSKFILDVDGGGSTFRLKNLLLGGWLVFRVQSTNSSNMEQWFSADLKPWVHFVPISLENMETDLVEHLNWALKNDAEASAIAERGRAFANKELTDSRAEWYQHTALSLYARWQTPSADSVRAEPSNALFRNFCCADVWSLASWAAWAPPLANMCVEEDSDPACAASELAKPDRKPSWLHPETANLAAKGEYWGPESMFERPAEQFQASPAFPSIPLALGHLRANRTTVQMTRSKV